jgi:hypothetical protein
MQAPEGNTTEGLEQIAHGTVPDERSSYLRTLEWEYSRAMVNDAIGEDHDQPAAISLARSSTVHGECPGVRNERSPRTG